MMYPLGIDKVVKLEFDDKKRHPQNEFNNCR